MPLPAGRQTPNLEDQWLERSIYRHRESPASKTTQANLSSGGWNYGREIAENFAESGDFCVLLYAENLLHGTAGFTSPPKEGK